MSCKVAFIGLGVMGYPMAGYISKAGHNVTVYNRTSSKADKWVAEFKGSKAILLQKQQMVQSMYSHALEMITIFVK